jgi:metal-responsive CopG/Arc/MetJ family transcriptional regulator
MNNRVNANRHYNPNPDLTVRLSVHVPDSMAKTIDQARGETSRTAWVREAITQRMEREGLK